MKWMKGERGGNGQQTGLTSFVLSFNSPVIGPSRPGRDVFFAVVVGSIESLPSLTTIYVSDGR
jgi:hypothetical protein